MPRFAAGLEWLFTELDLMQRFGAAKDYGFAGVELLSPYEVPVQDIVFELSRYGLKMALTSCPPPNYTGGDPGYAAVAGAEARFRQDFKRTLRYAKAMSAENILIMAGRAEGAVAHALFVENLRWAADQNPKQTLVIEALNEEDQPGYFLGDVYRAFDIVAEVDRPNLRLQFDTYHTAKIHGTIEAVWDAVHPLIGHVQVAQAPDRSEPTGKQIDFPTFYDRLDADGYAGWVGAEYRPKKETTLGLDWLTS